MAHHLLAVAEGEALALVWSFLSGFGDAVVLTDDDCGWIYDSIVDCPHRLVEGHVLLVAESRL